MALHDSWECSNLSREESKITETPGTTSPSTEEASGRIRSSVSAETQAPTPKNSAAGRAGVASPYIDLNTSGWKSASRLQRAYCALSSFKGGKGTVSSIRIGSRQQAKPFVIAVGCDVEAAHRLLPIERLNENHPALWRPNLVTKCGNNK